MAETVEQRKPAARPIKQTDTKIRDWMLTGFVMGTIFGFLLGQFVGTEKEACPDVPLVTDAASIAAGGIVPTTTDGAADKPEGTVTEPVYDFYQVLPEPTAETSTPTPATKPIAVKPTVKPVVKPVIKPVVEPVKPVVTDTTTQYMLQTGSFRQRADADKRIAKLASLGVSASTQSVIVKGVSWHRVVVGPIIGQIARDNLKQQLRENKIDSLSIKSTAAKSAVTPVIAPPLPLAAPIAPPAPVVEYTLYPPVTTPPVSPPTVDSTHYLLQVGSFPFTSDAENYQAELALSNVNTFIQSKVVNGRTMYRVFVGPFASVAETDAAERRLLNKNIDPFRVTVN